MVPLVDVDELVKVGVSMAAKLLLTGEEKKVVSKTTGFKVLMEEQQDVMGPNDVQVRVEKVTPSGRTSYTTEVWQRPSVAGRVSKTKGAVHEILRGSRCRLFFDLDGDGVVPVLSTLHVLDEVVREQLGFLPHRRVLKSTGHKDSGHVYYDVTVEVDYARHIATLAKGMGLQVDTQVYRVGGSLRLPLSKKIADG